MSGAQQVTFMNQRSFGPPPLPTIGAAYEGGFFAGQISMTANGVASHNLVVAPLSTGQLASAAWKTTNTATAGTFSVIDGPTNSANMNNASHPAAQFCEGLVTGGYSDWYSPALNEMEVCYYNLKPTTTSNVTYGYANPNAVPSRSSNYTTTVPPRTSAAAFQSGGAQAFTADTYWSSTSPSDGAGDAWRFAFNNGQQYPTGKNNNNIVRAIRRVPV